MENPTIIRTQVKNIESTLRLVKETRRLLVNELVCLVSSFAGSDPITFNDGTGCPQYIDYNEGCVPIVAVRVAVRDGKTVMEFNNMCGDDDYGLNPNGWYGPEQYGTFDVEDLLGCIKSVIESKC